MTNLAHSPTNDTRRDDLIASVREFGRLAAQGKDALPMLALKVAYAAADGVISLDKRKDGGDDCGDIYAEYVKSESKKAVHEHTAGGLKANVSKLRQIVTAGTMPTCDFYGSINNAIVKRTEMIEAEQKVRPMYQAIVELARVQIAQPDDLTIEQIVETIKKPEANESTVETELKGILKKLDNLIEGTKGVKCADQEIVDARNLVETKLTGFINARDVMETIAKANALGIALAPVAPVEEVTAEGNAEPLADIGYELADQAAA